MQAAVIAFCCGMVLDIVNVWYFRYVQQLDKNRAALFSMLVGAPAVGGILQADAHWTAYAALILGYGVGTYLGVSYAIWKRRNES